MLGVGAQMQELRRVRSGVTSENDHLVTVKFFSAEYISIVSFNDVLSCTTSLTPNICMTITKMRAIYGE
jgi:tRNA U55 pseudouridine synthase TruB